MESTTIINSSNNASSPSLHTSSATNCVSNEAQNVTQNQNSLETSTNSIYTRVLDTEQFLPESQTIIREFLCPLCLGVFYNPVIDPCGHVFCNHCFNTFLKHNTNICPKSGKPYTVTDPTKISQSAPSYFTQIIGKQKLRCIKKDCDWVYELSKLYDHIRNECIHVVMKCQFKDNGCKFSSIRSEVKLHEATCNYRIFQCELCKEETLYFQKIDHKVKCKKELIECPQKCSAKDLERDILEDHILNKCENSKVNCEFAFFGCKEGILRKNFANHNLEERKNHVRLLHQSQQNFTEQVKALCAKIKEGSDLKKAIIQSKPPGSQYYYDNIYKFRENDLAIVKEIESLHAHLAENIKYNRRKKEKLKLVSPEENESYPDLELDEEDLKIQNESTNTLTRKKRGSERTDDEDIMSVKF